MIAVYFGVHTMGRIIGFTFTLAAIVSLLQYPAALYADKSSFTNGNQDDDHFVLVNVIMLGICILPIATLVWYDRSMDRSADRLGGDESDEMDESFARTKPSPRVSAGMLLSSPGSGLRDSLRHVQRMRTDSST